MKKEDFKLLRVDDSTGHKDCWYSVSGDSQKELTDKYMEQSMVKVNGCVYSKVDKVFGIKRLFPFNFDVISPCDKELENILVELSNEIQ